MFRNFIENCPLTKSSDESLRFILLSKSETDPTGHIDKLGKAVDKAQKSVIAMITFPLFMRVKHMDEKIWKKAVRKGVKFRFMIGKQPGENLELALDDRLKKSNYFEVRWVSGVIPASVLLVDNREVFCRMGVRTVNPVLWSSAISFIGIIKDYLDMKWRSLENT